MHFVGVVWEASKSTSFAVFVNLASLIGLYLAIKSVRDSKDVLQRIDSTAESVKSMAKTLSTRFQGEWPDYLPKIAEVLESARHEILILSLNPGIGIFSSVRAWIDIANTLDRKKLSGVKITLIAGEEQLRIQNHRRQFRAAFEDWEGWLKASAPGGETNEQMLRKMKSVFGVIRVIPRNAEELVDSLNAAQNFILGDTYADTDAYVSAEYLPIFAWIADGRVAVFGISNSTGVAPAFYTEDTKIVDSLTQLARRYRPR